jgi:hypothetical protein
LNAWQIKKKVENNNILFSVVNVFHSAALKISARVEIRTLLRVHTTTLSTEHGAETSLSTDHTNRQVVDNGSAGVIFIEKRGRVVKVLSSEGCESLVRQLNACDRLKASLQITDSRTAIGVKLQAKGLNVGECVDDGLKIVMHLEGRRLSDGTKEDEKWEISQKKKKKVTQLLSKLLFCP